MTQDPVQPQFPPQFPAGVPKPLALEMVAAAEGQGRDILSKWTGLAASPKSYGQIRDFIEEVDAYASFLDLTETKVIETNPPRTDQILAYLSQLRVQLLNRKLAILEQFMTGLFRNSRPLPLGGRSFFKSLQDWVRKMKAVNNQAIQDLGQGPLDGTLISVLDGLIKEAIHASRDLESLVPARGVIGASGAGPVGSPPPSRVKALTAADQRMLSITARR